MLKLDLSDPLKCSQHPLTRLVKLFQQLEPGEKAEVPIRIDVVPLDLIILHANKNNVNLEVKEAEDNITILLVEKERGIRNE